VKALYLSKTALFPSPESSGCAFFLTGRHTTLRVEFNEVDNKKRSTQSKKRTRDKKYNRYFPHRQSIREDFLKPQDRIQKTGADCNFYLHEEAQLGPLMFHKLCNWKWAENVKIPYSLKGNGFAGARPMPPGGILGT